MSDQGFPAIERILYADAKHADEDRLEAAFAELYDAKRQKAALHEIACAEDNWDDMRDVARAALEEPGGE